VNDFKTAGNAVHGMRAVWVPIAVVAVLLALIAAEGIFSKVLPDGEALASGTVIEFGADRQASVKVGEGWTLDKAASDVNTRLFLTRGDMTVELTGVVFDAKDLSPREMWAGMRDLLDIDRHAGTEAWLDDPAEFDTASISGGLHGSLQIGNRIGTAFVLPGDDDSQAVEAKVLAPFHAGDEEWNAATALVDSIAFIGEDA